MKQMRSCLQSRSAQLDNAIAEMRRVAHNMMPGSFAEIWIG